MGLVQQIRSAALGLGWSVQELLEKSGLPIDRSTLQRKLSGRTPATDKEIQELAAAIRLARPSFRLVWPKQRAAS